MAAYLTELPDPEVLRQKPRDVMTRARARLESREDKKRPNNVVHDPEEKP